MLQQCNAMKCTPIPELTSKQSLVLQVLALAFLLLLWNDGVDLNEEAHCVGFIWYCFCGGSKSLSCILVSFNM